MSYIRRDRVVLYLLMALILLAAALRLWRLDVLPPGLYNDEAINGVDERMLLAGRGLPIYFSANNGREPLFLYLQAAALAVFGYRPIALRLVAALAGMLTVPAVYYCTYWLLRPAPAEGPGTSRAANLAVWSALLAAAGVAVSFWALSLSRLALRAVLLPPLSAMAVACFWRGWSGGQRRHYLWAAAWLAAGIYTYTAARALPLVPVLFVLLEALLAVRRARRYPAERPALRALWRHRGHGLLWFATACALLLLPLGMAGLRQSDVVWRRAGEVSIFAALEPGPGGQAGNWAALGKNIATMARNFYDLGDRNLRQNLPGRPLNDLLLAGLFTAGWLCALWRARQARYRLLLVWLAVMLLPLVLSTGIPHNVRAAAVLAPLAVLYGVGAHALLGAPWPSAAVRRGIGPVLLAAVVLVSGISTVGAYFGAWAASPGLGQAFSLQQTLAGEAAAQLLADSNPSQPLLMSAKLYYQPHMAFALGLPQPAPLPAAFASGAPRPQARFLVEDAFDPDQPMVLLWHDAGRLRMSTVEPLAAEASAALAAAIARRTDTDVVRAPLHRSGWPELYSGMLPPAVQLQARTIENPLDVRFANGVRLAGYAVTPAWLPGAAQPAQFKLSLFWEIEPGADPNGFLLSDAFVHLKNAQGVWQTANGGIPTHYLAPWLHGPYGVEDRRVMAVPPAMPRGKALFEVGVYRGGAGAERERVDIIDGQGRAVADRVDLGTVAIGQEPPQADLSGLQPLAAQFAGRIQLAGWAARSDPAQPDVLNVDLGWRSLARASADYTAFVHLIDGHDQIVAQADQPPGGTPNPTTHWVPGETLTSTFALRLPAGTGAAGLRLRVGLYEPVSGKQLPVAAAPAAPAAPQGDLRGTYLILPWVG